MTVAGMLKYSPYHMQPIIQSLLTRLASDKFLDNP